MDEEGSTESYPDDSIYSGLTVDDLPRADAHAEALAARVAATGAKEREVRADEVSLMLAKSADEAFTKEGWIFEIKYDGYRLLAERHERAAHLRSRAGNDLTETFPELARAVRGLPYEGLVLDGEVVVHDAEGLPSFSRLQRRGRIVSRTDALRASVELPASYYAFDLLALEGRDLRSLPLLERKAILHDLLPTVGPIRYADHVERQGEAMYAQVTEMGLEGIVAKKADAPYRGGRSGRWVKVRAVHVEDFVVVGWTEPKGSRAGFGALHLARYEEDRLRYRGSVGSGFSDALLDEICTLLAEREVETSPCEAGPLPRGKSHHWVRPELVVEVGYKEMTDQGLARQPVFSRLRLDKRPEECSVDEQRPDVPSTAAAEVKDDRAVALTNLDKVFWPEEGYTKGDLIDYHRQVADWMLPYLEDRPLVMTRYPDGIEGKSFFQKDAPPYAPDWIRRVTLWSESSERELSYFVVEDVESLLYVINLGTIPLHIWSSRVSSLSSPDWCVLDLDPKDAPFAHVVTIARTLHELGEEIGLPTHVKTSGSSGIHVLIPLAGKLTYEQSRTLAQLLARIVVSEQADIATLQRNPDRREGKVYVDFVQNGHGRLIAAPYTVRPLPRATVSAPLAWREVTSRLSIGRHTIRSMPRRLGRLKKDPLLDVLHTEPDLMGALERLTHWFD